MATNETYTMTSHNLLNYSGALFNKGNTQTPFCTLIGGKSRTTNSFKFVTSLDYTTGGGVSQPSITETASLTAPNAEFLTRTQNTNYCQIFQRALSISYTKQSVNGQLSGLNIAGAEANPANELDFQVANSLLAMQKDMEYSFLNGSAQEGTYDDVAYKTGGIVSVISTNTKNASSAALGYWIVAELVQKIYDAHQATDNLVLMAKPVNIMQLNADAASNGLTIVDSGREINGIRIRTLMTPFGDIGVLANPYLADGTAVIVNPDVCSPVFCDVPDKGNFFLEPLAKTGAADKYQLYGQAGLDYGAEVCHAKVTSLSTSFVAPNGTKTVLIGNTSSAPVQTKVISTDTDPVITKTAVSG